MVELFGKYYHIDIDAVTERCRTETHSKRVNEDEEESESLEINIFKYEIIKMCLETVLGEYSEPEDIGFFSQKSMSVSFRLAFNTLIKQNILIEEEYE